jgi:hypothetical protein
MKLKAEVKKLEEDGREYECIIIYHNGERVCSYSTKNDSIMLEKGVFSVFLKEEYSRVFDEVYASDILLHKRVYDNLQGIITGVAK